MQTFTALADKIPGSRSFATAEGEWDKTFTSIVNNQILHIACLYLVWRYCI